MNLLISNDDGIFALGIRTLANTLAAAGHTVTVVCPDRERSATGHGLTIHKPIRVEQIESVFHDNINAWACSGTPSDCIKLALGAILDEPPNMVCSGINHGANLGTDVLYSGTVSAAMEGALEDIPSIAFSLASFSDQHFQPAADFAATLVTHLQQHPLPPSMLLNVNVPAIPAHTIAGVKLTRQGIRRYHDFFEKRIDPRGKTYYWLAGEVVQEVDAAIAPPPSNSAAKLDDMYPESWTRSLDNVETDVRAIQRNYITMTPLQFNLTSHTGLHALQQWPIDSLNRKV
jgi:5'-nucleotidase